MTRPREKRPWAKVKAMLQFENGTSRLVVGVREDTEGGGRRGRREDTASGGPEGASSGYVKSHPPSHNIRNHQTPPQPRNASKDKDKDHVSEPGRRQVGLSQLAEVLQKCFEHIRTDKVFPAMFKPALLGEGFRAVSGSPLPSQLRRRKRASPNTNPMENRRGSDTSGGEGFRGPPYQASGGDANEQLQTQIQRRTGRPATPLTTRGSEPCRGPPYEAS